MSAGFCYSAFGFCIRSEFELPELTVATGEPDIVLRTGAVRQTTDKATNQIYVINTFAGKFQMNYGREVVVDLLPNADPQLVRVLLLGKVMAGLLCQRGWLPLHSSGVEIDGKAVLFIGPSGVGKSTLAAALYARGHPVITDDVGAIQTIDRQCMVRQAFLPLRLTHLSLHLLGKHHSETVLHQDKYTVCFEADEIRRPHF